MSMQGKSTQGLKRLMKLVLTLLVATVGSTSAHGGENTPNAARQKAINFEESLIEGMGKKPLDSFQQLSQGDESTEGRKLYRIRSSYLPEVRGSLVERRGSR